MILAALEEMVGNERNGRHGRNGSELQKLRRSSRSSFEKIFSATQPTMLLAEIFTPIILICSFSFIGG